MSVKLSLTSAWFPATWVRRIDSLLPAAAAIAVLVALTFAFMVVPNEQIMGPMQRIVYFHAGCATASYVIFLLMFFSSVGFFFTRAPAWTVAARAAGEVGLLLCTIVLLTGMIWGHAAWNTWFRFEPRLVTFLLLWLLLIGFNALQQFGDPEKREAHTAVLGLFTSLTVPLMVYSVKLLPNTQQLHPQVVAKGGFSHPSMLTALLLSILAMVLLSSLLVWMRFRIGVLEWRMQEQEYLDDLKS